MPLKFTKNQTLILEVFFNHPEKSYYLHELGRMINKKPGVFQKDINKLVENDILQSEYQANNRFFKLNKSHPLYSEFKSIFFKTVGIEGTLRKFLKKIKDVRHAFIYGSFAKGREHKDSDIDLMIIGSAKQDDVLDMVNKLEDKFRREINYTLISEKEYQEKIKKKDSFLDSILKKKRIELI